MGFGLLGSSEFRVGSAEVSVGRVPGSDDPGFAEHIRELGQRLIRVVEEHEKQQDASR